MGFNLVTGANLAIKFGITIEESFGVIQKLLAARWTTR
jgi:hypothetical protein